MPETIAPTTVEQLRDAIRWAADSETALEVRSRGGKASLGRPMTTAAALDLSGFADVKLYEPEELIITLGPGARRADIEAQLAAKSQMLPFEPPDYGPLFGVAPDADTIGGAVGINAAGPRRLKAGSARDFVLGVRGVSGFADVFKSGGRVVKNVSGYDLSKLVAGSYGTLAALSELTLKVLPKPETETTLLIAGLSVADGAAALRTAAAHPCEASGFAYLPAEVAAACPAPEASGARASITIIRVEGASASLPARVDALAADLPPGDHTRLGAESSAALWKAVRDVEPLRPPTDVPLWRLSVPPSDAAVVVAAHPSRFWYLDWAGGLIWLAGEAPPQVPRGSATLFRANADTRASLPFMASPDPTLAALAGRVKDAFDPKHILNPGRMYEGV